MDRHSQRDAYIERFNGKFWDKCLHANWFLSLDDARDKIEALQTDYAI
jgi:putative transposase